MPENPLVAVAVLPPAPAGDTLPIPTPEQERAADQLFSHPEPHHAAIDLLGMVASVHFLHDLAGEMFRRSENEEEQPELKQESDRSNETEE
jgi:hypothetical protein